MNRKTILRWLGEMFVVFVSVVGAFWFEDYRHNRQEKQDYINTLHQFRNHLSSTVWQFRISYDTTVRSRPNLIRARQNLMLAESMLSDSDRSNDTLTHRIIIDSLHSTPDFRESSIFYDQLKNYGDYIQGDEIFWILNNYQIIMNQEYLPYLAYNERLQDIRDYLGDKIDFDDVSTSNPNAINSFFMKNSIHNLLVANRLTINRDFSNAQGISRMVELLDGILIKYEIDSAQLDRRFLIVQ